MLAPAIDATSTDARPAIVSGAVASTRTIGEAEQATLKAAFAALDAGKLAGAESGLSSSVSDERYSM